MECPACHDQSAKQVNTKYGPKIKCDACGKWSPVKAGQSAPVSQKPSSDNRDFFFVLSYVKDIIGFVCLSADKLCEGSEEKWLEFVQKMTPYVVREMVTGASVAFEQSSGVEAVVKEAAEVFKGKIMRPQESK